MFGFKKTPRPVVAPVAVPVIASVEDWHVARQWNLTPGEWNAASDSTRRGYRENVAHAPGPNARVS